MSELAPPIAELLRTRRVLVLCGPGGVGKTTTAAALGLAAAQAGRRVLVLTVDPARRLADALGLPLSSPRPTPIPADRLFSAGIPGPGTLDAWMLDPRVVFEGLVHRLASPEQAERVLKTRLFGHLAELVAGMQEYTAAEALYTFVEEGRYDLVVLDTPPSRNALDFLDAPGRLTRFLEDGILDVFMPKTGSSLLQRAGRLVGNVFSKALGDSFVKDLEAFLGAFSGMFGALRSHGTGVRELLGSSQAAFLLVTSAETESIQETLFFRDSVLERGLPFAGFILNRSLARLAAWPHPSELELASDTPLEVRLALKKLHGAADRERARARAHAVLLTRLASLAGEARIAVAAPLIAEGVDDLAGLLGLAQGLAS
jgi:anion-transporting  ArsA/GET3 family ATPase